MKLRSVFTVLLTAAWLGMFAQSPAAQVKNIQKNPAEYINAESTDPNEDEAYSNAMRQIIDMSRNFLAANADNATVSDDDISEATEKIVIPRGEFKRVFVYVKRDALLAKVATQLPTSSLDDRIASEAKVSESNNEQTEDAVNLTMETETSYEIPEVDSESADHSDFSLEDVPEEIVSEVIVSADVPVATKELITLIQQTKSLKEAAAVLNKYKDRRVVSDFGVARQSRNAAACYWVVEENGGIYVLGPEIRGHRLNFQTGKTDALYQYTKGIWFRKR